MAWIRRWAANDYCVQEHLFLFIQTFLARDNEHEASDTLALLLVRCKNRWPTVRINVGVNIANKSIPTHWIQSEILSSKCSENDSAIISFTTNTPFHLIEAMPSSIISSFAQLITANINFRPLI